MAKKRDEQVASVMGPRRTLLEEMCHALGLWVGMAVVAAVIVCMVYGICRMWW